ncbi:DUF6093 family protein [Janibacter terrae]|uniref:DUF6093 family protein n=1 Tax=Janibacter terrae TaxID=103817 RepID=UPI00083671AD|nr:DUF6093 family protein [Janibacter terrae]
MPFPGTRVVPTGWSRHHQPVASGGMNAACVITDPAHATPGAWDDTTGTYAPSAPFVLLPPPDGPEEDGWPCRVQAIQSDQDAEQAGQASTTRRYLVQLHDPDLTTLPDLEQGHVVTIVTAINDPHLTGLDLVVEDVQHGSERFTRDLVCTHNQQPPTS